MQIFFVVVTAVLALGSASKSYSGYKVFDVTPTSFDQSQFLKQLSGQPGFDFWSLSRLIGDTARVMVEPNYQAMFEESLAAMGIDHIVTVDDVEEMIIAERLENENALRNRDARESRISFDAYYRHDQMNLYLDELAVKYPKLASVKTEGLTFENRSIKSLRISSGGTNKPIIVIDAGIHARDWAAPASALYIIYQLLENSTENAEELLNKVDWIILPTINPDGYEYSYNSDRLWKKSRSIFDSKLCPGTHLNRNFDFHWREVGASSSPCTDTYAGPKAFSDPESRVLRDILLGNRPNIKLYFSINSVNRNLMYPWGYTSALPSNWEDLDNLAKNASAAIRSFNVDARYTVGTSAAVRLSSSGRSDDYALGAAGVPFSYSLELPDGGSSGYDPAPYLIKKIVVELYVGFKVLANFVKDNY